MLIASLAYAATNVFPPEAGFVCMLREDTNGDYVGEFAYKGRTYEYHARGYGKPVLITASISPRFGSYAWRYIFECLAGTRFVYSLDIEGTYRESGRFGRLHYVKLIEYFLREIIETKSSILSGGREYSAAMAAAFEARGLVDRIVFLCPDGISDYRLRGSAITPEIVKLSGMPATGELRKMVDGANLCTNRRLHSGALPGGKSPFRVCEDIMRLLG